MRISTPTEYLAKNYGYEKALEMIAVAGFDFLPQALPSAPRTALA